MSAGLADGWVRVPAGEVRLSDRRTQRSWSVDVEPFALAVHPVTAQVFAEVMGGEAPSAAARRHPAAGVSWLDAVQLCNVLSRRDGLTPAYRDEDDADAIGWDGAADGYRLPTEAEWEHACRAGTTGPRYGELDDIAWYRGTSGEQPHDVGLKAPNGWGLHDMLGGVWEWCWDVYDAQVYGSYRVLRGGGWFDEPWSVRASVRRRSHPTLRIDDVGLRLARSLT